MIVGIVGSQEDATAEVAVSDILASLDFKNGIYTYGATSYTAADVLDTPSLIVPGAGLVVCEPDTGPELLSPFSDFLITGDWTIRMDWAGLGLTALAIGDNTFSSNQAAIENYTSSYIVFDLLATGGVERDLYDIAHLADDTIHCTAWTRQDTRTAASTNGGSVDLDETNNVSFAGRMTKAWLARDVNFNGNGAIIGRIDFYAAKPDADLPGLSLASTLDLPANNAFANAITINVGNTLTGCNALASAETGEPAHSGDNGGRSVWWVFTAPASTNYTVNLAGSQNNGDGWTIGVYTGSAVNALSQTAYAKAYPTPSVTFAATSGAVYHIAVDGWGGGWGRITIALT